MSGYKGQTSFPGAVSAPYFGYQEPFQLASEWWYPVADGAYQSPDMLKNFSSFGRRKSHKKRSHKRKSGKKSRRSHKRKSAKKSHRKRRSHRR